ncbi:MAG TPA: DUF6653 family protein [Longimicrobium sp.]|nr:DUF6653 family protein [Longimicrobium sp.]
MTIERAMADAFRMDERAWARHANPWSVWTRNTALPLLSAAVWSRTWLGWWALAPVALAVLWTWLNPRLFPPPASTGSWASRAVLGERVWLNRGRIPVPEHHRRFPHVLSAVAAAGVPFVVWGLARLEPWPLLFGAALVYAGKLWFLDRMVWLYDDMKDRSPEYQSWLY